MNPTSNGHKHPNFSLNGSRANKSLSAFPKSGLILSRNFGDFQEILVQGNKTVYVSFHFNMNWIQHILSVFIYQSVVVLEGSRSLVLGGLVVV